MTIEMTIKLTSPQAVQTIVRAIDQYKNQLRTSIERTQRKLAQFEQQYNVTTPHFLAHMTAEDLPGGDWEYVEWAGEAKLLAGLEAELEALEHASLTTPQQFSF